mgnify:CR=1 FL=1
MFMYVLSGGFSFLLIRLKEYNIVIIETFI